MAKVTMKQIHEMRDYVLHGVSVNTISEMMNIPSSTVRLYTKAERGMIKILKMQRSNQMKVSVEMTNNKEEQLKPDITDKQNKFAVMNGTQINFFEVMQEV